MAAYELHFPDYLDGYEVETEAKGYLVGVRVSVGEAVYELTVYDDVRLAQEIGDELRTSGHFAVANLLVVGEVTRAEISAAVERLAEAGFDELVPTR
jgi:hypothetical protein